MTRKTSMKNIEIILAIRELQKMISDTEAKEESSCISIWNSKRFIIGFYMNESLQRIDLSKVL